MAILVTGATGTIGRQLLPLLANQGVEVRALTRTPEAASFPTGITPVAGDLLDVAAMRSALDGVRTLFLLAAVTPQELTQSMLTLSLAYEAGIQRVVYLSVFHGEHFADVPHFASKYTVERMLAQLGIPATILRPNYFMQNDAAFMKQPLLSYGVYPMPIGAVGVSMVDTRDIAAVAAQTLLQRERASAPLPAEVVNVVGPEALTGADVAAIWSTVLERPIPYTGGDTRAFEQQLAHHGPGWMAMDMRLMLDRFQRDGMCGTADDVAEMTRRLGRPPRSYAAFAQETLAQWQG